MPGARDDRGASRAAGAHQRDRSRRSPSADRSATKFERRHRRPARCSSRRIPRIRPRGALDERSGCRRARAERPAPTAPRHTRRAAHVRWSRPCWRNEGRARASAQPGRPATTPGFRGGARHLRRCDRPGSATRTSRRYAKQCSGREERVSDRTTNEPEGRLGHVPKGQLCSRRARKRRHHWRLLSLTCTRRGERGRRGWAQRLSARGILTQAHVVDVVDMVYITAPEDVSEGVR